VIQYDAEKIASGLVAGNRFMLSKAITVRCMHGISSHHPRGFGLFLLRGVEGFLVSIRDAVGNFGWASLPTWPLDATIHPFDPDLGALITCPGPAALTPSLMGRI